MSKNKQIIEVTPPEYGNCKEGVVLSGFDCPRCSGRGWVPDYGIKETVRTGCERCGGMGRLRANVSIEWEEDGIF
jgi:DnaJ-class molecular chaperone